MVKISLGLGTNFGKKLDYLRKAVEKISIKIGTVKKISSIYQSRALLPRGAISSWDRDYYNIALEILTNLEPLALLDQLQMIEIELGRNKNHLAWSPRVIDIDILTYGDTSFDHPDLKIPHKKLLIRRFALEPLLEINPNWHYPNIKIDLHQQLKKLPLINHVPFSINGTKIMGVINLSRNSFSSGKTINSDNDFENQVIAMVYSGAEIIDIGAESTKPGAKIKTDQEVWKLLSPYLQRLESLLKNYHFPLTVEVSIDTYHYLVLKQALQFSCVSVINDVYGNNLLKIINLIKNSTVKYIFMNHCSLAGKNYLPIKNSLDHILKHANSQKIMLIKHGLKKCQLIFDLGIGFGKYPFQTRELLSKIGFIKKYLKLPILVGHSRKNSVAPFLYNSSISNKDIACAIITHSLCQQGVDYVRVHNISINVIAKNLYL